MLVSVKLISQIVSKYYGYSLQELTILFDILILSLFTYMQLRFGRVPMTRNI